MTRHKLPFTGDIMMERLLWMTWRSFFLMTWQSIPVHPRMISMFACILHNGP